MRLIDADRVLGYIDRILAQGTGKKKSFEFIRKYVANMPTIDIVQHGRWIIDTKFGADVMSGDQMVICSVCGRGIFWGKQTYCPHCGAKMDEVDDHDDHL